MIGLDEANYALQNIMHRRLRSGLSILSIVIGVMAIFALSSFGLGLNSYVKTIAQESGTDKLFIQAKGVGAPGTDDAFYLSQGDVDFVEKISGVNQILGLYQKPGEIIFHDQKKYNYLLGGDMKEIRFIEETFASKWDSGRRLKPGETDSVVLGYNYKLENKIFKRAVKLGDIVQINGRNFYVVGFYASVGNPQDDGNIFVSKETIEELYPASKEKYSFVIMRADPDVSTKVLAERVSERLRKHKDQDKGKEDFFVQTFEDAIKQFENITIIILGVVLMIALISVVVAAVNIMNTMYTAVLERTGEIGVMKAVGARNTDIMFIFVFEAGVIGMIGGIIGVLLGRLVSTIGGYAVVSAGFSILKPIFPIWLTIGCILFSFAVGIAAGFLPAYQASKLKPVDALRYE